MNPADPHFSACGVSLGGAYVCYAPNMGEKMAWIIYHHLTCGSVPTYLDLKEWVGGHKKDHIGRAIRERRFFVLVLNDRQCAEKLRGKTEFRCQVDQALRTHRVIVPFVHESVLGEVPHREHLAFRDRIPKRLNRELSPWERVEYEIQDFDDALDKLLRIVS